MAQLIPQGIPPFLDANGDPLVGGTVTYAQPGSGGAALRPIWIDEGESTPAQNPVPLNAAGQPYSGGSAVPIWGVGIYEQIVKNASGATIWTAIVDATATGGGGSGGIISGNVQIDGNLSVVGDITDTQSLSTPQIFGDNADFPGGVTIGNLGVSTGAGVLGGLTADDLTVTDTATFQSLISKSSLNGNSLAIGAGGASFQSGIALHGSLNGSTWNTMDAGQNVFDGTGHVFISLTFHNAPVAVTCTYGINAGTTPIAVRNVQPTGFDAYGDASMDFYWIALSATT